LQMFYKIDNQYELR